MAASSSKEVFLPATPHLDHYRLIGKHSLRVSPLCLGTMNFGTKWSWMGDITKDTAEKIFDTYVQKGGNFIDTANKYHEGETEEWLGEWITKRGIREDLVIATKFSLPMKNAQGQYTINGAGNGRKHMFHALDESLKRLRTHYVDITYVHFHDFTTKPQELMRSLDDLVRSGKTRFVAVSDTPAWQVSRSNMLAELRGWSEFIAYQGRYHLGERDVERDILPMCRETETGFIPWAVLGQGKFTGRYQRGHKAADSLGRQGVKMSEQDYNIAEAVSAVAEETGRTPSQVCINWVLQQKGITSALLGVRTLAQLEDNLKALEFTLTPDQIHKLSAAAPYEPGFPHNFIGTSVRNNPWLKDAGTIWTPN